MKTPELVGAPIRREGPNQQNNKQNISYNQSLPNRPGMPNRPDPKFNGQKSPGIRKPVSPNELLQLQKTNKSDSDKKVINLSLIHI